MKLSKALDIRDMLLDKYQLRPQPSNTPRLSPRMAPRRAPAESPSIALGVTESIRSQDYLIAVRIQSDSERDSDIAREISEICRGETDVLHLPVLDLESTQNLCKTIRPLQIGSSVASIEGTAGTLGLIVRSKQDGGRFILSNNHVLVGPNHALEIVQPGPADNGSLRNRVATLANYTPVHLDQINFTDAAIAKIDDVFADNGNKLPNGSSISGISSPPVNRTNVSKIGRTTGYTKGRVRASSIHHVKVKWGNAIATFSDCIEIVGDKGPFSAAGDSGSVILNERMEAVGLLFAGGKKGDLKVTYACNLTKVMLELGLSI